MIVVTGATGKLGRLVIEALLAKIPANEIAAAVRDPSKAADLAARGVQVRKADYTQPDTLSAAFAGAEKVLLISSSAVGQRVSQHRAVIDAAKSAGVQLLGYTSMLHADTSPLGLAAEHVETERMLKASGVPHVVLRNGWYSENHAESVPTALAHGAVLGSAGEGRIASASRADYAEAAATAMTRPEQTGRVYELAGDSSYSLAELAADIALQSGKSVIYKNLAPADYRAALVGFGLPGYIADLLADSDVGASKQGLFDDGKQLSALIGRPTTPMAVTVADVIRAQT